MYANGTDGFGTRVGLEMIASRVNTAGAVAQISAGMRIGVLAADPFGAYYVNGLVLQGDMTYGVLINNTGAHTAYGLWDMGVKAVGLNLTGIYGLAAIRLNAGQKIAFETTGTSTLRADASFPNLVGFEGCQVNFERSFSITSGAANIASSAAGGAASALPALPSGYIKFKIDGTTYKFPYYN